MRRKIIIEIQRNNYQLRLQNRLNITSNVEFTIGKLNFNYRPIYFNIKQDEYSRIDSISPTSPYYFGSEQIETLCRQ